MLHFIYGDGTPFQLKYNNILNEIKNENPKIKEKYFDFSLNENEEFIQNISQNSIFSTKEIFVVKRLEKYKNIEKFTKIIEEFNLSEKDIIFSYEEFLNEFGKRTDESDKKETDKKNKIIKKFENLGKIYKARTEDFKKSTISFVEKELKISEKEAQKLIEIIGEDYYKVKGEVDKITSFLNGEEYSLEKIEGILIVSKEFHIKKLVERFFSEGEKNNLVDFLEKEKIYFQFLGSVLEELILFLKLKLLIENGVIRANISYNEFVVIYNEYGKRFINNISKRIIPAYPIFLKIKIANKFHIEFLEDKIIELGDIEYEIKNGHITDEMGIFSFISRF
ncbi:MAG: hypothetical protein ACRC6K_05290 [Fusobacteriaceae bacterium]